MIHRSRTARVLALAFASALVLAACGGSTDEVAEEPMSGMESESMADMETGDDHADGDFAFGHPAEESEASRTIQIRASDDFRFSPDAVDVAAGETVTFVVENVGKAVHEFVIGDEHAQEEHETEMQEMSEGMEMHDEANAIDIDPGETKSITWTFAAAGEVLYGCHEPGHYQAGMVGTITVG